MPIACHRGKCTVHYSSSVVLTIAMTITIQTWNRHHFENYSLYQAGLIIQLGHDGKPCPHPRVQDHTLTIIDSTAIHTVGYSLCGCDRVGLSIMVQFMRAKWFPASTSRPRCATTFRALKLFHALTMQGKVNPYDFYNGIHRLSSGSGTREITVSA